MSKTERIVPKRLAIILTYDGVQAIDLAGPAQALTTANDEGANPPYVVRLVALAPGKIATESGFPVVASPLPRSEINTVFVPGGPGIHRLRRRSTSFPKLTRMFGRARRICSICSGAFLLAEMGVLNGKRVVTHWRSCERLGQEFPDVNVEPDPIYIRDGNVWTTAGVTAGIDLALALIEDDHGRALAARVARRLVVYMRRPAGQRQFSEPLALQSVASAPYRNLLDAIVARPAASWTIDAMSKFVGQSPRSFHRHFLDATGQTPGEAVEKARCDLARSLLQTTSMKVKQIATRTGFRSESAMRRALQRQYGVAAQVLRKMY